MPVVVTGGVLSGLLSLYLSWVVFQRWRWMPPIVRVCTSVLCWGVLWVASFALAIFLLWPAS